MNYELRKNLTAAYELCDSIEATPYGQNIVKTYNMKIRHIIDTDLIAFLTYLSTSDGRLNDAEIRVINEYFPHFNLDAQSISEAASRFNIRSADFENTVPRPIEIFVDIDKKFGDTENGRNQLAASSTMYVIYFDLAKELIERDANATSKEIHEADAYVGKIRNYIFSKLNV